MSENFSHYSDEKLMESYQLGEENAFKEIYKRHSQKIYGYLRNNVHDKNAVDDLFQTTFMKLHHSRNLYNTSYPFLSWVFTICRNSMIDHFRKVGSLQEESNPMALEKAVAEHFN